MKKKYIVFCLIAIFIVAACAKSVIESSSRETARLQAVETIRSDISAVLSCFESENMDETALSALAEAFNSLDRTLKDYTNNFPSKGESAGAYPTIFGFEFIARSLGNSRGQANCKPYSALLADGVISDKEEQYLSMIHEGMKQFSSDMAYEGIASKRIEIILNDLFSRWNFLMKDSPYFLLLDQ